jgi:signal recognition particle receptor subunit beta
LRITDFENTRAIIFVIDSTEDSNWTEQRQELQKAWNHPQLHSPQFLILANKQDLPSALTLDEIKNRLGLQKWTKDDKRKWALLETSGITGEGLYEGLEWLYRGLQR